LILLISGYNFESVGRRLSASEIRRRRIRILLPSKRDFTSNLKYI
jgi:hypothetical protein